MIPEGTLRFFHVHAFAVAERYQPRCGEVIRSPSLRALPLSVAAARPLTWRGVLVLVCAEGQKCSRHIRVCYHTSLVLIP